MTMGDFPSACFSLLSVSTMLLLHDSFFNLTWSGWKDCIPVHSEEHFRLKRVADCLECLN